MLGFHFLLLLFLLRCRRLNLQPLAYLWRRREEILLKEMISSNIEAIIIKVAAFGMYSDSEQCCLLKLQWTNHNRREKKKNKKQKLFYLFG